MRISNYTIKSHLIDNVQSHTQKMDQKHQQMTTGKRNLRVSDSPIEAINSLYSRVRLNQVEQYQKNLLDSKDLINLSHDKIMHTTEMLHRIRELALQSSNGTYNKNDRKHMAFEVEELLRALIQTSNTTYDDEYLYAGAHHKTKPFLITETQDPNIGRSLVESVDYVGSVHHTPRDIALGESVRVHVPGNEVFWGEMHTLVSLTDAQNYVLASDQMIQIDGKQVQLTAGDNLDAVVNTINREVSTIRAFKQRLENGNLVLGLESTYPHRMTLEDMKGGTVLQDLGLLRQGDEARVPGRNVAPNVLENGGSVFDAIIGFRDDLINNNTSEIPGRHVKAITASLHSLLESQSKISSLQERLIALTESYRLETVNLTERLSHNEDMDMAEASIQLKQIQNVHRISLMTASKYITPTLMDYLN